MDNYFTQLNAVDCSDKIEKKGNLSYLSWAFAWAEIKKRHPDAVYTIYEDAEGRFYHTDGRTCWVKTGVTVNGIEHIEYLPVMNNKNRSIPLESVTSFDVNTSIQRSLTKACARHGLGLYIYAGEDVPQEDKPQEDKPQRKTAEETKLDAANAKANEVKKLLVQVCGGDKTMAQQMWTAQYKADAGDIVKMNAALIELTEKLERMNALDA